MKNPSSVLRTLLGLVTLLALGLGLAALLRTVQPGSGLFPSPLATPSGRMPQSPLETPPPPPRDMTPIPMTPEEPYPTPRPTQTPRPTAIRPTPFPSFTPTVTPTPAPPTPTPTPLPPLPPALQTLLYIAAGEGGRGAAVYRVQVDAEGRKAGEALSVQAPHSWQNSRTRIIGLYPAPVPSTALQRGSAHDRRVAIGWIYGEGGDSVLILDVETGRMTPLFGENATIGAPVVFLDWAPDGESILFYVYERATALEGGMWLMDLNTYKYRRLNTEQDASGDFTITSASFSSDGRQVVYAQTDCYRCGSEIWRIVLDDFKEELLFKHPHDRVEEVRWSPRGDQIAFVKWYEPERASDSVAGELWVMDTDGGNPRQMSSAVTGYIDNGLALAWSPDGSQIAFVMGDGARMDRIEELRSNIYVVDVGSKEVAQATWLEDARVVAPTWSPDGTVVAFIAGTTGKGDEYEIWMADVVSRGVHRFDASGRSVIGLGANSPALAWLP